MTAPATGRTADENELREAIARLIEPEAFSIVDTGNADPKGWAIPLVGGARHTADRLLSGPLAPILQEAATARKERDEALKLARMGFHEKHVVLALGQAEAIAAREAAEQEAATLRARLQEAEKVGEAMRAELSRRPPEHGRTFPCPKCGTERGWLPACAQDGCPLLGLEGEEVTHAE